MLHLPMLVINLTCIASTFFVCPHDIVALTPSSSLSPTRKSSSSNKQQRKVPFLTRSTTPPVLDRRDVLQFFISYPPSAAAAAAALVAVPLIATTTPSRAVAAETSYSIDNPNPRAVTTLTINSSKDRVGLELQDVTIGTPPRTVIAIRNVFPGGLASKNSKIQKGMIVLGEYGGKNGAQKLVGRIQSGPYPIELRLYDLAAAGDAYGDLGKPIISSEDALNVAEQTSSASTKSTATSSTDTQKDDDLGFVIKVLKKAQDPCAVQSRRGDMMEIKYEAHIGTKDGPVYDSSDQRGTGQPYQYVLGNNDVIKGVDLGTYDMCPGEIRELYIPPPLGYGQRGSKLFDIPGNARLYWRIELVRLNFIKEGENDKGRDELYDGGSGLLPSYR